MSVSSPSLDGPHEEADWIRKQRKTFQAWCNHFLQERNLKIERFEQDLSNGVLLANLLELLSRKKLITSSFKQVPKIKLQAIHNLNVSFDFLEKQHIKLVNLGAEDIYDGDIKLILGLIWTLILRFQIQQGEFDEEGKRKEGTETKKVSVQAQLLSWCNEVLSSQSVSVTNFQESWQDGLAFCGLLNSMDHGGKEALIDISTLNPENRRENMELAFGKAYTLFGIPRLLDVEDMVEGKPDDLSVMTYVSYFRQEMRHRLHAIRKPSAAHTIAAGDGLEDGKVYANEESRFIVFTKTEDGSRYLKGGEKVQLKIFTREEPKDEAKTKRRGSTISIGKRSSFYHPGDDISEQCHISVQDNDDGTYSVSYEAPHKGYYIMSITLNEENIKDNPMMIIVKPPRACASKSTIIGDGIQNAKIGETSSFIVQAKDKLGNDYKQGGHTVTASIRIACSVTDNGDGTYTISYTPKLSDALYLDVELDGEAINGSPFPVAVENSEALEKNKHLLEAAMKELNDTQQEREKQEQMKAELARKIEDEVNRTAEYEREMVELREQMRRETQVREEMAKKKEEIEKQLEMLRNELNETKQQETKKREELNAKIENLQQTLEQEQEMRRSMECLRSELFEDKAKLSEEVSLLERKYDEEQQKRLMEEEERKKMESFAENLKREYDEVYSKYEQGLAMLEEFQASQKIYQESIEELKHKLAEEEQAKKNLERFQKTLRETLAEKNGLATELNERLAQTEERLKQQSEKKASSKKEKKLLEEERRQLASAIEQLKEQLESESKARKELESVQSNLEVELKKRRQSRALLQEEVDMLHFRLEMDTKDLSSEQQARQKLEQELEELTMALRMHQRKGKDGSSQMTDNLSAEAKKELEDRARDLEQKLRQVKGKYEQVEQNAKSIEEQLREAVKQRDDLETLQKKLEDELRARRNSRANLQEEMTKLKKMLEQKDETEKMIEEERSKELQILKKKLEAETKARKGLEELKLRLEEELQLERLNMIPTDHLDELEAEFDNAKNQLELELLEKEKQLHASQQKALKEERNRIELQRELDELKKRLTEVVSAKSTSQAVMIYHTASSTQREMEKRTERRKAIKAKTTKVSTTTTTTTTSEATATAATATLTSPRRNSTWMTAQSPKITEVTEEEAKAEAQEKKKEKKEKPKQKRTESRRNLILDDLKQDIMPSANNTRTTSAGNGNGYAYTPRKGDEIDEKVAAALGKGGLYEQVPLEYVRPGVYRLGNKNISFRILNGYLVIRVGGGYMHFEEWYIFLVLCTTPQHH
ncbi:Alpha-actinin, variant 2 [Balamuthia mandrillaris]